MLYIYFNNKVPNEKKFEYAIQGDNKVDVVDFDITGISDLTFDYQHAYIKVQSKDKRYTDKIECIPNGGHIFWSLLAKTTAHKVINIQLSFESDEKRYQTEIVEITLKPYIDADGQIENDYPTVLQDLQEQIDELKEQGGGGGASSVEIEKVWLTYDDKKVIRSDYLGRYVKNEDDEDVPFINDSTRIWVNFKTTPINLQMEQEIKNGRFVIRLDYPVRSKNDGIKNQRSFIKRIPQTNNGVNCRSFTHTFNDDSMSANKKEILLNSLIFVNESDIKVNSYGEKYIHKKISYFNFINSTCKFADRTMQPLTNDEIQSGAGRDFFDNYLLERFALGIPSLNYYGIENNFGGDYGGNEKRRRYVGRAPFSNVELLNGQKLNPAFNCYAMLNLDNSISRRAEYLFSPFYLQKPYKGQVFNDGHNSMYYLMLQQSSSGEPLEKTKHCYMVARPRCCVVNDDYETADEAFIKKYPQSTQQIKWYCKAIFFPLFTGIDGYYKQPIFRMIITPK